MPDQQLRNVLRVTEALEVGAAPRLRRGSCRASVKVENTGPDRAIVRQVRVTDVDGLRGEPGSAFSVRAPALLRPGSERRIPIRFDVPRTSPAGTYRFDVDIAGTTERMTVHVPVRHALSLSPSSVMVAEAGTSIHTVVASNRGNVAVSIDGVIAVPLDEELIVCRSLRGAIAIFDDETVDPDEVTIDQLVAHAAETAHHALHDAILRVRFTAPGPLEPGTSTEVQVKITTPSGLDPRSRYEAFVPVLDTTLGVFVLPRQVGGVIGGSSPDRPDAPEDPSTAAEAPAEAPAAKDAAARKSPAKKAGTRKAAAEKAAARKSPAKKAGTKKAAADKAAARKRT